MTNGERLVKEQFGILAHILVDNASNGCSQCSLNGLGVCSCCHSYSDMLSWLKSPVQYRL